MNYFNLLQKIEKYKKTYDVKCIGKTELNRKIIAVEKNLDSNFATAILVAGVHAREHITTDLLCKMLDERLFDDVKNFNISFVLMLNPDGVELCHHGLESVPFEKHDFLIDANGGSLDFSLWKANAKGVDINNNFDARFGTNTSKNKPSSSGFVGEFAESENETKALVSYLKQKKTFFTVSYHSKGEEIYFNFFQDSKREKRDEKIAKRFATSTGYLIVNVQESSSGGFKDFCVEKLKIPAITIEVGSDELLHPIGVEFLNDIFEKNKNIAKDLEFAYNEFIKSERE